MLTRVLTDSTSDKKYQANTVGKDIDPVSSLRLNYKGGSKNLYRRRGRKLCGKSLLFKLTVKLSFLELLYCRFQYYKCLMAFPCSVASFLNLYEMCGPFVIHAWFGN